MRSKAETKAAVERAIESGIPAEAITQYIKDAGFEYNDIASTSDKIAGYLMNAVQGLTMGSGDEIVAGVTTGFGLLGDYEQKRDQYRTAEKVFDEANPWTAGAAEFAGGMATGIGSMKNAAQQGWKEMAQSGLGLGTAAGFGYSEADTPLGVGLDTASGALAGTVMGAATPSLINLAKTVTAPFVSPMVAWSQKLAKKQPSKVVRDVSRDLMRDDLTIDNVRRRLDDLGPEGVIADVGGENTQRLAEHVAKTPGPGAQIARTTLNKRDSGASTRILERTANLLGKNKNYYDELDSLYAQRQAAATPIYKEFVEDVSKQVDIGDLAALMQKEPYLIDMFEAVAKDKALNLAGVPPNSIRFIDAVKKRMYDKSSKLGRAGEGFKSSNINNISKKLVKIADDSVPEYADARKAFEAPTRQMEAMDQGRNFMKNDFELTAREVEKMTPEVREAFLSGVMRKIDDVIMSVNDGGDVAKRVLGSQKKQKVIRAAFGDDATYDAFEKFVNNEKLMFATRRRMTVGSPTQPLQAKAAEAGSGFSDLALDLSQGNLGSAVKSAGSALLRKNQGGYGDQELKQLADILYGKVTPDLVQKMNAQTGLLQLGQGASKIGNAGLLSLQNTQGTKEASPLLRNLLEVR